VHLLDFLHFLTSLFLHGQMLSEVLTLILMNVQQEHHGPTSQSNAGPCVCGQACANVHGKNPKFSRKFPIVSGKHQWNQHTFGISILPCQEGVTQHKCDGCNTVFEGDEWSGEATITGTHMIGSSVIAMQPCHFCC
jgi:hypothetical protein